jgi:hypothetical protein
VTVRGHRRLLALVLAMEAVCAPASAVADDPATEKGELDIVDPPPESIGDPSYAEELVAWARANHVWEQPQWEHLGHWIRSVRGTWEGQPDGPLFYLAPDGKTDPEAELEATIRGIWAPEPGDPDVEHPLCRFPARMAWLAEIAQLDASRLPRRRCAKFEHFAKRMRAESVALVFSAYYLNSPASAFGHTFLRLHRKGNRRGTELLDEGIDYAAVVDTSNAFIYAVKGLTGMFPGRFSAMPYYYKVREYNDYESRDLWEYELNLSPHAVAMLVAHLWELGSTYFDYYYLSENCSYHSLAVLEVADPSLDLMTYVKYPTVPIDTVRALFKNPGLVRAMHFRPSLRTRVRHDLDALTAAQVDWVSKVLDDPKAPFPPTMSDVERAQVLDVASDIVDMRDTKAALLTDDPVVAALRQTILERRAEIHADAEIAPVPIPVDKIPNAGHQTARVSLGTGYAPDAGGAYYELGGRVALHDLADAPDGYPETSQIEFLPTRVRYYPDGNSFQLEDLWLVRVLSLSPWARFQKPLSFAVRAGALRLRDSGCFDCIAADADVAGGLTFGVGHDDTFAIYALGDVTATYSPTLRGLAGSTFRAGIGPVGGFRWRLSHTLVWTADGGASYLPDAHPDVNYVAETTMRWEFAPNLAAGADLRRWPLATEGSLSAYFYY